MFVAFKIFENFRKLSGEYILSTFGDNGCNKSEERAKTSSTDVTRNPHKNTSKSSVLQLIIAEVTTSVCFSWDPLITTSQTQRLLDVTVCACLVIDILSFFSYNGWASLEKC